jgi:pyrophosphatase PpaX
MPAYPVWLFDFDGTLVDTHGVILDCYRHAALQVLGEELPGDVIEANLSRTLREASADVAGDRAEEFFDVYVAHSMALHADEVGPFEGVTEMLMRLRDDGCRLGIVTSKLRSVVELVLDQVSYGPAFEVIVTVDDTELHKPEPEPILYALERLKVGPDAAIYVGDSPFDILAARAAGVASGAALWGLHAKDDLLELWPTHAFESPLEVIAA